MADVVPERMQAGAMLAGRYRLEAIAGSGGMAIVWRAWDERLARPVAIKVMSDALSANPTYASRFAREARIAAQISHANLVAIYDYSATAAQPYLVMQYIEGGTLEARLAQGPIPQAEVLELTRDLLAALTAVHSHGVLHRDVKPANVLRGPDGRARLTDFGVARLDDGTRLTQTGHLVGTLRFLAPELVTGADPSPQSDLFSLGVLLSEAAGDQADPRLAELITALTASDPSDRPASAEAALAQLDRPRRGPQRPEPTRVMPANPAPPVDPGGEPTRVMSPPWTWRARGLLRDRARMLAALLVVAAVVIVVVLLSSGGGTPRSQPAVKLSRSATLAQRFSALEQEIRSAPGH